MLLNSFFKIISISPSDKYKVKIELNSKHEIYNGHFPGNPVVPGVCLTQMVKETIQQIIEKKLTMVTGDNIKFTAVLNPEITPIVEMTLALKTKENGLLHADATLVSGDQSFFSFKGSFKEN